MLKHLGGFSFGKNAQEAPTRSYYELREFNDRLTRHGQDARRISDPSDVQVVEAGGVHNIDNKDDLASVGINPILT